MHRTASAGVPLPRPLPARSSRRGENSIALRKGRRPSEAHRTPPAPHPSPAVWGRGRPPSRGTSERPVGGEGPRGSRRTAPSPFHPFTPSPVHPFTLSPVHPFTLSPFHPFTLSPFHPFTRSPVHPFTRSPVHPFTLSPFHPFTPPPSVSRDLTFHAAWSTLRHRHAAPAADAARPSVQAHGVNAPHPFRPRALPPPLG